MASYYSVLILAATVALLVHICASITLQVVYPEKQEPNEPSSQYIDFSRQVWLGSVGVIPFTGVVALAVTLLHIGKIILQQTKILQEQLYQIRIEGRSLSLANLNRIGSTANQVQGALSQVTSAIS
jgi:hypothetical protein